MQEGPQEAACSWVARCVALPSEMKLVHHGCRHVVSAVEESERSAPGSGCASVAAQSQHGLDEHRHKRKLASAQRTLHARNAPPLDPGGGGLQSMNVADQCEKPLGGLPLECEAGLRRLRAWAVRSCPSPLVGEAVTHSGLYVSPVVVVIPLPGGPDVPLKPAEWTQEEAHRTRTGCCQVVPRRTRMESLAV